MTSIPETPDNTATNGTLSPGRRRLADEITAIITGLTPQNLDGDTIVAALCARDSGCDALAACVGENNGDRIRKVFAELGDLAGAFVAGISQPKPTDPTPSD